MRASAEDVEGATNAHEVVPQMKKPSVLLSSAAKHRIAVVTVILLMIAGLSIGIGIGFGLQGDGAAQANVPPVSNTSSIQLRRFSSCTELTTRLGVEPTYSLTSVVQLSPRYTSYEMRSFGPVMEMATMEVSATDSAPPGALPSIEGASGGASDFSTTNVQVLNSCPSLALRKARAAAPRQAMPACRRPHPAWQSNGLRRHAPEPRRWHRPAADVANVAVIRMSRCWALTRRTW